MISKFTKQLKGAAILGALLMGSNAFAQLGLTWGEMGPNDISGRCRSIIVDKTDLTGNKMFAAGVSGGIFKSTNAGANWSPVNDLAPSLIVSCMDQDASGNIYFGTGETFGNGGDGAGSSGFRGTGLYKVNAALTSYTQLKDSTFFGNVNEVAVNGSTIYVAADKGFFVSVDGGLNFTEEANSFSLNLSAMDVKIAKNGDVYYSGGFVSSANKLAGAKTSSTSSVYYAPAATAAVSSPSYTAITPTVISNRGRIEIATSPVDPNYVYLSIAKMKTTDGSTVTTGGLSAVMGSNNMGANWTTITLGTAQFDPLTGTSGKGDYANTIVADPTKKDALYIGGDVFYSWSQITGNNFGQGIWNQIGININIPFAIYIHPNIHDVKFNGGNNSMYVATDGGIFKSVSNNSGFLPYNKGLNISQMNSVTAPNFPRISSASSTTLAPVAGVAGGSMGNSLIYLPGNLNNDPMTSSSFGSTNAWQSEFSKINPKALFYAGSNGILMRTNDIEITPPSTYYDVSYKLGGSGGPGASTFANENTPFALWENYFNGDSAAFINQIVQKNFPNSNTTQTTFTFITTRPQASAKYDSILVYPVSTKKALQPSVNTQTFVNSNTSATSFTINNTRTNAISKYDSVTVKMTSFKKSNQSFFTATTFTNMTSGVTSFSLANTRPFQTMKYDSIVVNMTSFKLTPTVAATSFTIRPTYSLNTITGYALSGNAGSPNIIYPNNTTFNDSIRYTFGSSLNDSCVITVKIKYKHAQTLYIVPAYTGSVITNYSVLGEANTTPGSNTITLNNSTLIDNIRYTFIDAPNDSSIISVRARNKYYQSLKIMPVYTGSTITGYTLIGESNNTPTTNIQVILNNTTLVDTVRYTFKNAPNDSSTIMNTIKYRYNAGDNIYLSNTDISGSFFTASVTLTAPLAASITPIPMVKVPLRQSARVASGVTNTTTATGPSIFAAKRPLNFSINPDWAKIAGKNSRVEGGTTATPILGITVTRLKWSPDGASIYFSTKLNDSTFYLYRISHLQFLGDSSSADYSGLLSSDIDSLGTFRKYVPQRTTPIGKFKNPITGIAITADNINVMITCGGYKNNLGTVYYSNSDARVLPLNNTDASNFTAKNGSGLGLFPAYTCIFEKNDNKRALVGTELGIYSTLDITQASPVWSHETGGNFPNVPVFQLKQQTLPSWLCYNSGVIYAATHGRGIWSTDKYFTPYAIGIQEQKADLNFSSNIKLYPNPASDATNVWFKAVDNTSYKLRVYDINGRLMLEQNTAKLQEGEQVISINTGNLTSGVYFVSVVGSNSSSVNTKLVITH